jgi:hypothetical protein
VGNQFIKQMKAKELQKKGGSEPGTQVGTLPEDLAHLIVAPARLKTVNYSTGRRRWAV